MAMASSSVGQVEQSHPLSVLHGGWRGFTTAGAQWSSSDFSSAKTSSNQAKKSTVKRRAPTEPVALFQAVEQATEGKGYFLWVKLRLHWGQANHFLEYTISILLVWPVGNVQPR